MLCCAISDVVHLTKECKDDKQSPEESLQSAITGLFKSDTKGDYEADWLIMYTLHS